MPPLGIASRAFRNRFRNTCWSLFAEPRTGYELHAISVEGLSRTNPLRALRAFARAAAAVPRARRLLRTLAPDAVMGGGGYVAAPVVIAARTLGIPAVLTEADSRIGLSNRMLAPLARRVCLSFGPAPASSDRRTVAIPLPPRLADGAYTLVWYLLGSDGHLMAGEVSFSVGAGGTAAGAAPAGPTPAVPAPASHFHRSHNFAPQAPKLSVGNTLHSLRTLLARHVLPRLRHGRERW